ncbi:endothelin-converting enzyme 1-like [Ornithodoros turicata]|uniref:endothelin-converting enzyme 1-like n=1 Tax=Ornithodoros turicata TaxID=34597 RepID=UPI00313A2D9F
MQIHRRIQESTNPKLPPTTPQDPRGSRFKLSPRGLLVTTIMVFGASALVVAASIALYDRHKPMPPPVLDLRPPRDHPWQTHHIPLYYTCNSDACRSTGEDLRKNVAWSLSPCDDFYEYVCSSDRPATNVFEHAVTHYLREVKLIIKKYLDMSWFKRTWLSQKVAKFYSGCMTAEYSLSSWASQLSKVWELMKLHDIDTPFEDQLAWFSRYFHAFPLVHVAVAKVAGKSCLILSRPEELDEDPLFQVPHAFSKTFLSFSKDLIGMKNTSGILKVESLLAEYNGPLGERFKKIQDYGQQPVHQLKDRFFDWFLYLKKLLAGAAVVETDSCVVVKSPHYVSHISKVLQRATRPELSAFLRYRTALQLLPFRRLALLSAEQSVTDQMCTLLTYRLYKYVFLKHFNDSSILQVYVNAGEKEVITRMSYRHMLTSTEPVSSTQREVDQAIKRATATYFRHMVDVENYYQGDQSTLDMHNVILSFVSTQGTMAKQWLKSVVASGGQVFENQLQVRWDYDPDSGQLTVPVSIAPLDIKGSREFFLESSTLGSAMLRFIYYAFHEQFLFQQSGANATECLIAQYNALKVGNVPVNGHRTLRWNAADTAVVPALHRAFKTSLYIHKIEVVNYKKLVMSLKNLPDVDADQLFFLMYGQTFCDTDEDTANVLTRAPWVPARLRLNVPLSNYREFSRAFKCPRESNMNSKHHCSAFKLT